jgi:hypothetical protein
MKGLDAKLYTYLIENNNGRGHFRNVEVDGRIIIKCISKKQDVWVYTGFNWLRI